MTESPAPVGSLLAARLVRVEIALLARVLAATLAEALPPGMVAVDRYRSVADRLARRPGVVVGLRISAGERTLALTAADVGNVRTSIVHTVRGVILSTQPVSVAHWLDELGDVLNRVSAEDDAARAALERAVQH